MLRYTLRQIEYFVAVGETGSIARAAERLNVSSPSISAAIAQLEQELGLPLFVRHHAQGLSLTSAGRRMLEQARRALREAGALRDMAGEISGQVRGPLALGCLVTFAQILLPALRRGFEEAHPDVRVSQRELNQMEILSGLRRSEIDMALTYDLDVPADLRFVPLVALPPHAVLPAMHPLAGRARVRIEELAPFPMVLLDLPHSADYFLSHFAAAGLRPEIAERTRDMAVMRSLVANGYGYSIANVLPLSRVAPDGKPLVFVPIEGKVRPMRMGLLMAQDAEKSNAVRAFAGHVSAALQSGSLPVIGTALTGRG